MRLFTVISDIEKETIFKGYAFLQVDGSLKLVSLFFFSMIDAIIIPSRYPKMIPVSCWCLIFLLLASRAIASDVPKASTQPKSTKSSEENSNVPASEIPHSRTKRLIWVTDDGRLALPPGTSLVIAPTLAMPFVRYPPDGFHSNISISIPLTSKKNY
jgi:hypothetical protein